MKDAKIESEDDLRPEYDLNELQVRKLGPGRKNFGDVVRLEPDVAAVFTDADAVNVALRSLIKIAHENRHLFRDMTG
ncbi:hypothetical protein TI04_12105 [Achromatium sp. WMS2]|nr:hypothetical protein TI04_12105 [Achromatium sp. WMS2]